MNGFFTWFNKYSAGIGPATQPDAVNNSLCRQRWLDGRNKSFKIVSRPLLLEQTWADVPTLPHHGKKWVSTSDGGGSTAWYGVQTSWYGPQCLGLGVSISSTGYLLYRYKYYFSFRQRKTYFLQ